jgi:hypothetical protein
MEIYKHMNKICTSLEQSQKLIELGIDTKTADMYHAPDANIIVAEPYITKAGDKTFIPAYKGAIPAWSLTALLGVLPKGTRLLKSATDDTYHCDCPKGNIDKWFDNTIDAAFEMVVWLKENGND